MWRNGLTPPHLGLIGMNTNSLPEISLSIKTVTPDQTFLYQQVVELDVSLTTPLPFFPAAHLCCQSMQEVAGGGVVIMFATSQSHLCGCLNVSED